MDLLAKTRGRVAPQAGRGAERTGGDHETNRADIFGVLVLGVLLPIIKPVPNLIIVYTLLDEPFHVFNLTAYPIILNP